MSAANLKGQGNGATPQEIEARSDIKEPPRESQTPENDVVDNNVSDKGNDHHKTAQQQPVSDDELHIQRPPISVPPIERLCVNTSAGQSHPMKSQE